MTALRQAAQAVINRWDSPLWKDVPATAVYIADLRTALAAPEQEPVATVQCIHGVTIGYLEVMQPVGTKLYVAPVDIQVLQAKCDAFFSNTLLALAEIDAITKERDALKAAAKLALDALVLLNGEAHLAMMSDDGPVGTYANKVFHKTCLSLAALKKAGV